MTRLAIPALAILLTSCASPSLPPLPESYDQPAMRRIVEAEPFVGPVQPSPGKFIAWDSDYPCFVDMATFANPNEWQRVTNGVTGQWETPGPGLYRVGVEAK